MTDKMALEQVSYAPWSPFIRGWYSRHFVAAARTDSVLSHPHPPEYKKASDAYYHEFVLS